MLHKQPAVNNNHHNQQSSKKNNDICNKLSLTFSYIWVEND